MKAVRKAVFPVAGLGTRFLPATKAQPKEMLPLVDKPVIQYAVEEAVAAGVELIIIVTPRLTSPSNTLDTLPNPLRNGDEPTAIDLILMGIASRQPIAQPITGTN